MIHVVYPAGPGPKRDQHNEIDYEHQNEDHEGPAGKVRIESIQTIGTSRLQSAIDFGQALAAWNCGFLGARGGMYAV